MKKNNQELYRCIDIPKPPGCPTDKELQEMNEKSNELNKEIIKDTKNITKDVMETPGTTAGGPLINPRPRIP